ncbi:hypothetical protein MON38_17190 [Hymenobacter sp. DH14]|uniref:Uncharacterized protein n=1 Tax=Hymenobacter cyanobacteriorum TaxID=2926463 RepID=A0A9X1VN39_9BACT|nr:hypothetical protein [Hymenobacter cyanobacteriorum]MCI1189161.1 hypothetical protein [Hymenobacter cyanobacteriorum]
MSFLRVTTTFLATLHDARVEYFAFDDSRGRLLLTLLLDADAGVAHCQQLVVLSGIRHKMNVARVQRAIDAELAATNRPSLGYRLNEFHLLPKEASASPTGLLSIRLAIDHLPSLQLCCQKITHRQVTPP